MKETLVVLAKLLTPILIAIVLTIGAATPSSAAPAGVKEKTQATDGSTFFQPYTTSDWVGLGLTAAADFADMDSSYSMVESQLHTYNKGPTVGSSVPCTSSSGFCTVASRTAPAGEGNPLIYGLFNTRYPTPLDYTAFGVLELVVQSAVAYAIPEKYRPYVWGIYIGIGGADTIMNTYSGGVAFRF